MSLPNLQTHRHPRCNRLQLESLEARLPLGDALLGAVVGSSLLGSALPVRAPGLLASESLSADTFGAKPGSSDRGHPAASATADSRADTAMLYRPVFFVRRDNDALGSSTAARRRADHDELAAAPPVDPWQEWAPFWDAAAVLSRPHFIHSSAEDGSFSTGGRIGLETPPGAAPPAAAGQETAPLLPAAADRGDLPASTLAMSAAVSANRHGPIGGPTAGVEAKPIVDPGIHAMEAGELSFKEPLDYGAGRSPRSVATGDFRGNGILDLAVANFGSNDVSIFLGNGDGTFRPAETVVVGTNPFYVTTGHFHGPGILDLAVADSGSNEVSILLGHGDGSFGLPHNFSVGRNPQSIAIGDFRGIGISDLAVANRNSNNVSILLGNGNGTFAPASNIAVAGAATFVVAADFARDGRQDLAVTAVDSSRYQRGTLSILLGNGDGTFRPGQSLAVARGLTSMVACDFNGDGVADLAVAGSFTDTVSVLLGRGDGTFTLDRNYQVGAQPQSIAVGDFNGDGIPDLVTASLNGSVAVLLGNGNGTFQTTRDFWGGANPISVAVGDFNHDGRDDLAIAENFSNQVSVLLNNSPQPGDGITVVRNIVYYDGPYSNPQRQNLDVYVPPDRTDFPVVFLAYGGAFRTGDKSRQAYLARTLAREGLEVVAINYRVTDGSPQQVVFPAHEVDVARAFAWTYRHIAEYGGDPNRIILMGNSSGGMLVSLLATDRRYLAAQSLSPDVVRGVIGVSAGLYDERRLLTDINGPFEDVFGDLEQSWDASPLRYVDGSQPPFLVLYASNDNPGFGEDSTVFYQALVNAGSQAELHMIPGRNHQMIIGNAARPGDPARELILRFIAEHTQ